MLNQGYIAPRPPSARPPRGTGISKSGLAANLNISDEDPMTALIIAQIDEIHDAAMYDEYARSAQPSLAAAGGAAELVMAHDPHPLVLEGEWKGAKLVILKFATREKALEWYNSESYQAAAKLRQKASTSSLVLVDTLD
jgi:uncharacterized protein (DUF1330 family)